MQNGLKLGQVQSADKTFASSGDHHQAAAVGAGGRSDVLSHNQEAVVTVADVAQDQERGWIPRSSQCNFNTRLKVQEPRFTVMAP